MKNKEFKHDDDSTRHSHHGDPLRMGADGFREDRRNRRDDRFGEDRGADRGGPHRGRGRGFGPGFGPSPFGGGRAQKGDVRNAILSRLSDSNYNGYGLMKAIALHSDGAWRPSPGSVYPALSGLQAEGLIVSIGEGRRTEFELSEEGRSYVAEHKDELAAVWAEVREETGAAHDLRLSIGKLMGAVQQITMDGTEEQLRTVTASLDEARRTIYKLLSD
ncbi:transcriptional regulator PadR-like family [Renibacterium salmoninarum ATCC 33209]|uniref:Transcriptional regulator PadR-like family n=1 Tax=Renibacterium salmoninarum (strain ATCC 33209 / DSM 20767 / JCM 11484 / NBRC 15589 / NCIMB 2235) TaxID=288705 RepID=A9WKS9_RENSM|nr:PadR family transcriptional regulator [Renibacterium salmoninarum]ABY22087.1 transcriptional regulator PadR-like family [Renibacterium salmoninarum ATCC 33209]